MKQWTLNVRSDIGRISLSCPACCWLGEVSIWLFVYTGIMFMNFIFYYCYLIFQVECHTGGILGKTGGQNETLWGNGRIAAERGHWDSACGLVDHGAGFGLHWLRWGDSHLWVSVDKVCYVLLIGNIGSLKCRLLIKLCEVFLPQRFVKGFLW